MWDIMCEQNIYRRTYKIVSCPTGWDGIAVLYDDYEDPKRIGYSHMVKLNWAVK